MTKEKEDIKNSFYSRHHVKIFILLGIVVIVLIIISITFIVRTIFTGIPILRFRITGGILAFSSLLHAIFTAVIYRSRDKKSPYRILLILALIYDILLMHGGIISALIYIGPMT